MKIWLVCRYLYHSIVLTCVYMHVCANLLYVTRFSRGVSYTYSFETHFSSPFDSYRCTYISIDQQYMCPKVKQSAFTQASFSGLSDIHECSGGL